MDGSRWFFPMGRGSFRMRVGEPTSAIRYASPMFPMSTNVFSNVLLRLFFVVSYFKCFPMLSYVVLCFPAVSYLFPLHFCGAPKSHPRQILRLSMGGANGEDHGESEQRAQDSSTGKTKHDLRNTALLIELVLAQKLHPFGW